MSAAVPLPPETAPCVPGDYLLRRDERGWTVFRLEEFVRLEPLEALRTAAGVELLEQRHAMDSQSPPGSSGVHLLVVAFARAFASPEEAVAAVGAGDLGPAVRPLCLPPGHFPRASTRVHSPGPGAEPGAAPPLA